MTGKHRHNLDQRGFTLVLVLLVTVLLTVSIGAGFMLAGSEHEAASDHNAQLKAYAVAQEGLERYLTDITALPTIFPDTRAINVPGGTASVTLRRVMSGSAPVYAITSVGQANSPGLRRSFRTPVGERTISQFVTWQPASMDVDAAFTALSGAAKNGVSGSVSGVNECVGSPTPIIAGLAVPNDSFSQSGGNSDWIDGSPDNAPDFIGTAGTAGTAQGEIDVDWAGILAGSLAPDFVVNRLASPATGAFPTTTQYNNWPVVMVKGNLTNGDNFSGKGVLLVTGNAALSNISWRGVVLVGGAVDLSGSATAVHGALIAGLNIKLGQTVPQSSVGNGNFLVRYNSCDIATALNKMGGWRRLQNTWADNWPSYTVP